MPFTVKSYTVPEAKGTLVEKPLERRDLLKDDVKIDILYSGVCHSDIHQALNEWGVANYPLVPGHEIVGKVEEVGSSVTQFKVGDVVAVGVLIDSCGDCTFCDKHQEPHCKTKVETYNSEDFRFPGHRSAGGYSQKIVAPERFTFHVPKELQSPELLPGVAPIMCAGITTFAPILRNNIGKGSKVAVAGLGGLGSMAVKLAHAVGADVTVISRHHKKDHIAKGYGAHHVVSSSSEEEMKEAEEKFDLIIDTIPFEHDTNMYIELLAPFGNLCIVGQIGPMAGKLDAGLLVGGDRKVSGSCIGGNEEISELLRVCAEHKITSDFQLITIDQINDAYKQIIAGEVAKRVVIETYKFK